MVDICMFVDSDHPVETAVFGAKFFAMKQGMNTLRGLRYIPISGPSYIYGNNIMVVHNTSRPESILRKRATQFAITQSMSQSQWESS